MNRAAHLYRPAPTAEDLSATAEGMVKSANLKGYLQALARAYFAVYHMQSQWCHEDFWGLREFYSMIKVRETTMFDLFLDSCCLFLIPNST
jgi:hypothetical protein